MRLAVVLVCAACQFEHGRLPGTSGEGAVDANTVTEDVRALSDAPVGQPPACWTASGYNAAASGRKYRAPHSDATWSGAQAQCASTGAHLVVINDATENAHVQTIIDQDSWVGMSDTAQDGVLAWINGAPLQFTSWATSEPQNATGPTCVFTRKSDGKWRTGTCGSLEYACECPYP